MKKNALGPVPDRKECLESIWGLLRTDKNRLVGPVEISVAALCVAASGVPAASKPALVIVPDETRAEQLSSCLDTWWKYFGEKNDGILLPDGIGEVDSVSAESDSPRTFALARTMRNPARVTVASISSLLSPTPSPEDFQTHEIILKVGASVSMTDLAEKLAKMDYDTVDEIAVPGEFVRRGGVMDIYSFSASRPARVEFFGDEIDTIRIFDPTTQKSVERVDEYRIVLRSGAKTCNEVNHSDFFDYMPEDSFQVFYLYPAVIKEYLGKCGDSSRIARFDAVSKKYAKSAVSFLDTVEAAQHLNAFQPTFYTVDGLVHSGYQARDGENPEFTAEFLQQWNASILTRWRKDGVRTVILGQSKMDLQQINDFLMKSKLLGTDGLVQVEEGNIPCGMFFPKLRLALLTERELFGYSPKTPVRRVTDSFTLDIAGMKRDGKPTDYTDFSDLEEGDYAVHLLYGICIYRGLKMVKLSETTAEMIQLEFRDSKILSVPLWHAHYVTRYVGAKHGDTQLNKISGSAWEKTKDDAEKAVRSMAYGMLQMQAVRSSVQTAPCNPDSLDQRMFEDAFQFHETPDQLVAADEIKRDMESSIPMDRLLCGDVGFGKTELAMRAAFKAVVSGRQVAVLAPTTVLAQQHYYTFLERFRDFPVSIEQLSRFRSKPEQRKIIEGMAEGKYDIVIGTHRLVQSDVKFKNLGLIIIDEEQRFGVKHKDQLKKLRVSADVLTMTATPIPRTLYMSMYGIRSLSTLTSAPVQRLPVRTIISMHNDEIIRAAIARETARGGQVFFLYNRVKTIDQMAEHLRFLFPNLQIGVAHGQMDESILERVMNEFIQGKLDVLVCTTIIESGLDIPNANTIIIDRADCLGLAELYQLRGRVGRWTRQAYAYMLIPPVMSTTARERIDAIRTYTHLGAGFKLAVRDLEIRGAGNILGAEQSGQINAIGFHLYCSMLRTCVAQIHGDRIKPPPEVDLHFNFLQFASSTGRGKICACFDHKFINSERFRLEIYRRLATVVSEKELDDLKSEVADRFGAIPQNAENMFTCARIRILAAKLNVESITTNEDNRIYFQLKNGNFAKPNGYVPRFPAGMPPEKRLSAIAEFLKKTTSFK